MKKKNFELQRPENQKQETYIGTLQELKEAQEISEKNEKREPEKISSNIIKNVSKEIPMTPFLPITEKKNIQTAQAKPRKFPRIYLKKRKPGFVQQKPVPPESKKVLEPKKRKTWIWVTAIILLFLYISSMEIVKRSFPQYNTYTDKIYYPLQELNKQVPVIEKYQLALWKYYQTLMSQKTK